MSSIAHPTPTFQPTNQATSQSPPLPPPPLQDMASAERHILSTLNYELGRPTAINFLDHLLLQVGNSFAHHHLCTYTRVTDRNHGLCHDKRVHNPAIDTRRQVACGLAPGHDDTLFPSRFLWLRSRSGACCLVEVQGSGSGLPDQLP